MIHTYVIHFNRMSLAQTDQGYPPPIEYVAVTDLIKQYKGYYILLFLSLPMYLSPFSYPYPTLSQLPHPPIIPHPFIIPSHLSLFPLSSISSSLYYSLSYLRPSPSLSPLSLPLPPLLLPISLSMLSQVYAVLWEMMKQSLNRG